MAGPSWLVDSNRIATKIKSASGKCHTEKVIWKSNPTRACPKCQHTIDNSDVVHEWPGLPRGVKFDPSDQEIVWHLLAKAGLGDLKPHPFINEFIPTLEQDEGICYTHPQNLPGVKQDGSASHFFHRAIKAYNTGTRKRRKIQDDDSGDVRWHKTGRTKPVILDGIQKGFKKIMVLYMSMVKGGKAEKTNWVMHQYHLGTEEDEQDGDFVISKISYQQQQVKQGDKTDQELPENIQELPENIQELPENIQELPENIQELPENNDLTIAKVDPVTPKLNSDPPRTERHHSDFDHGQDVTVTCSVPSAQHHENWDMEHEVLLECEGPDYTDQSKAENHAGEVMDNNEIPVEEEPKWWDSESQNLLDSQQLVEGLSLCDDLLQSQSPNRDGDGNDGAAKGKPRLSDYAQLGPEDLKKDLEACQNLVLDPANIELDTPPEFRLSQLEFGSQDSFISWGGHL